MSATLIPLVVPDPIEAPHARAADAASRLADDVNAAAEALDTLRRSLRRQFPHPREETSSTAPEFHLGPSSTSAKLPWQLLPVMSAHLVPQELVPQELVASPLPTELVYAGGPEPRRFDMRGFLAGFALSAAIGALLYVFLAPG